MTTPEEIARRLQEHLPEALMESGPNDTGPLRRFSGIATNFDIKSFENFDKDGLDVYVVFQFSNVESLEYKEGYDEDDYKTSTYDVYIKRSSQQRSRYGMWQLSFNESANLDAENIGFNGLFEKRWVVYLDDVNWGKIANSKRADSQGNTWGEVWKIASPTQASIPGLEDSIAAANIPPSPPSTESVSVTQPVITPIVEVSTSEVEAPVAPVAPVAPDVVTGIGDSGLTETEGLALAMLIGNTDMDLLKKASTDSTIMEDRMLLNEIVRRVFGKRMLEQGHVTIDEDKRYELVV